MGVAPLWGWHFRVGQGFGVTLRGTTRPCAGGILGGICSYLGVVTTIQVCWGVGRAGPTPIPSDLICPSWLGEWIKPLNRSQGTLTLLFLGEE